MTKKSRIIVMNSLNKPKLKAMQDGTYDALMTEFEFKDIGKLSAFEHLEICCKALKKVDNYMKRIESEGVDSKYKLLFSFNKKTQVVSYLKSFTVTHHDFSNLVFLGETIGYSQSLDVVEVIPPDFLPRKRPKIAWIEDDGSVDWEGVTDLTPSEIKRLINQRKRMHIHMFEKEGEWHCFYFTIKDIKGEHHYVEHVHFISHLWGIAKEEVIANLKSREHGSAAVHVKYIDADRKIEK